MKQFLKNVLSSCLGVMVAGFVLFLLGMGLVAGIAGSSGKETVEVKPGSVLHLTFSRPVPEQTNNLEMSPFDLTDPEFPGLNTMVESIEHAAADENIKGIYLNMEAGLTAGVSTAATLREALVKFRESGKFIVAFSNNYTQGSYYLSSVADKIYLSPLGNIDFHGIAAMMPYFKDMLDRVGVKMEVFYAGDFKSATEPYRRNEMSEQNRLQMRQYLEPVYVKMLTDIGESRKKTVAELRSIADNLQLKTAGDAVRLGLADQTGYNDEVLADLRQRLELKSDEKINTVPLEDYVDSFTRKKDYSVKEKIALVFAEGEINSGEGKRGMISDEKYVKMLRKIREDKNVKAIVLRVNSPGGSAIASENIWRELTLAKAAGQKVVVSMGDYAASGGYYIACMADKIIAEPNTLTGSIGVFSMLPNASVLFEDKLGIHWDTVKTARYSTGLNPFMELSQTEKNYLQESTNSMYETFLKRVAEGRNMSRDSVHAIAQGRVWVGPMAKQLGLVDEIGGLPLAIREAATLAGLEDYRVSEYPLQEQPLQEWIQKITGQNNDDGIHSQVIRHELGGFYPYYEQLKKLMQMKGVQARLPVVIEFH